MDLSQWKEKGGHGETVYKPGEGHRHSRQATTGLEAIQPANRGGGREALRRPRLPVRKAPAKERRQCTDSPGAGHSLALVFSQGLKSIDICWEQSGRSKEQSDPEARSIRFYSRSQAAL